MSPALACRRSALLLVLALAGCTSSPPVQLYHLRSQPPMAPPARAASAERWQLLQPVRVPDYLDRESLLLPQGQSGLLALSGHRWAESLRDAVPRVLRQDLGLLLGEGQVWTAPLPAGLSVTKQLRVELLAFDVDGDRQAVRLQARWTVIDPRGQATPATHGASLRAAADGGSIDSLVAAHRLALWQLAERIAGTP